MAPASKLAHKTVGKLTSNQGISFPPTPAFDCGYADRMPSVGAPLLAAGAIPSIGSRTRRKGCSVTSCRSQMHIQSATSASTSVTAARGISVDSITCRASTLEDHPSIANMTSLSHRKQTQCLFSSYAISSSCAAAVPTVLM